MQSSIQARGKGLPSVCIYRAMRRVKNISRTEISVREFKMCQKYHLCERFAKESFVILCAVQNLEQRKRVVE